MHREFQILLEENEQMQRWKFKIASSCRDFGNTSREVNDLSKFLVCESKRKKSKE